MYDSCLPFSESFWRELTNIEILCFCRTLFEQLQAWGLHAKICTVLPRPSAFEVNTEQQYAGFFWQRRQEPSMGDPSIARRRFGACPGSTSIKLRTSTSPPATAIPKSDQERYRLRFSAWSEDRSIYDEALRQAGIYFAPRLYEGIGMSFLEAMAMGKASGRPDNPTMNEYLTHNVNGYLFDPEDPRPIALTHFREMGKMARETIERGRPRWLRSREEIGDMASCGQLAEAASRLGFAAMANSPAISVICLPSPNSADLEQTCLSVAAQDYSNIERLVASPHAPGASQSFLSVTSRSPGPPTGPRS